MNFLLGGGEGLILLIQAYYWLLICSGSLCFHGSFLIGYCVQKFIYSYMVVLVYSCPLIVPNDSLFFSGVSCDVSFFISGFVDVSSVFS
jgi:hypothetical protein